MIRGRDLRSTYGWRLSSHARQVSRARGVDVREVLEAIQSYERVYTSAHFGPDRCVYLYRDLAVVVAPGSKTVITVLWNNPESWTSEEFRLAHMRVRSAAGDGLALRTDSSLSSLPVAA